MANEPQKLQPIPQQQPAALKPLPPRDPLVDPQVTRVAFENVTIDSFNEGEGPVDMMENFLPKVIPGIGPVEYRRWHPKYASAEPLYRWARPVTKGGDPDFSQWVPAEYFSGSQEYIPAGQAKNCLYAGDDLMFFYIPRVVVEKFAEKCKRDADERLTSIRRPKYNVLDKNQGNRNSAVQIDGALIGSMDPRD